MKAFIEALRLVTGSSILLGLIFLAVFFVVTAGEMFGAIGILVAGYVLAVAFCWVGLMLEGKNQ